MTYIIRPADPDEAPRILAFLRQMHEEVGRAPLHPMKALASIADIAANSVAYVVENDDFEIVGSLGLAEIDFWYSEAAFLGEVWLYVPPPYRAAGEVLGLMLAEAKDLSERLGIPVFIDHHRPARPGAGLSIMADRFGFIPTSRILELAPGGH
jgi:hypothetical protein